MLNQFCCTVVKHGNLLLQMRCRMIRMIYGVRLVNGVLTDVLCDRVGIVLKIKGIIIQSHLRWHSHIIHQDINSQIREVMEFEITEKRKKG